MGVQENKQIVRRFIDEVFVQGRQSSVDELVADDLVAHTWPSVTGSGKQDLKLAMERVSKGLADASFQIDDMIGEDDRVAVRLTASARHVGDFMGLAGSGRSYTIGELHVFRLRDGKVVEHWRQFDQFGMMRQLGFEEDPGMSPLLQARQARREQRSGAKQLPHSDDGEQVRRIAEVCEDIHDRVAGDDQLSAVSEIG